MDASTTALSVARHLKARGGWSQLTVITNGLRLASELAGHPGITVLMLGGRVRWEALSVVGQLGDGLFSRINVQKAFLGAAGFTLESGLADATEEEAQIKRSMVAAAREVIAIVDHTKWERAAFATFCPTDQIDIVLTDDAAPRRDGRGAASARGIEVRLVGADRAATRPTGRPDRDDGRRGDRRRAPRPPAAAAAPSCAASRSGSRATQALDDVSLDLAARRGPRARRRERRRQEHAGQDPRRRPPARQRDDPARRRADPDRTARPTPARSGIAVVHQEPRLFPDLTVAENVFIGHAPAGRLGIDRLGRDAPGGRRPCSSELDVQFDVGAPVRGLSMADQQLIEIAKSLSVEARVLILDEPTASLSAHEVERLFTIVRRLRDRGVAILFVSHRLDEVFELCDRATVFRDGRHVVTTPTRELTTADLVRHMVGRAVSLFPKVETPIGEVLLEVEGLTRGRRRSATSAFTVRAGEIVGLAGLVGAGRTEVARVLFGIDRRDAGEVRLGGKAGQLREPVGGDGRRRSPTCPRTATRRASSSTSRSPRT